MFDTFLDNDMFDTWLEEVEKFYWSPIKLAFPRSAHADTVTGHFERASVVTV
jgi:hypothetical protein